MSLLLLYLNTHIPFVVHEVVVVVVIAVCTLFLFEKIVQGLLYSLHVKPYYTKSRIKLKDFGTQTKKTKFNFLFM